MIIKSNRSIVRLIIILCEIGCLPLAIAFSIKFKMLILFFEILAGIILFGLLLFILYILFDRKYYRVEETKIIYYKKNKIIKEFEYFKILNPTYVNIKWFFISSIAGQLVFDYEYVQTTISMSYGQALKLKKLSKLKIEMC